MSEDETTPNLGALTAKPAGNGNYRVQSGDCMDSLAIRFGHFAETLWNLAENSALRSARETRNLLLPGDLVFIPPVRPREVEVPCDQKHTFVRRGTPVRVHIRFLESGEPRSNECYLLLVDEKSRNGCLDSDGWLTERVPAGTQKLSICIGNDSDYTNIPLGTVGPPTSLSGLKRRLSNLGYRLDLEREEMHETVEQALSNFQKSAGLQVTGQADVDTISALVKAHTS